MLKLTVKRPTGLLEGLAESKQEHFPGLRLVITWIHVGKDHDLGDPGKGCIAC